MSSPLSYAPNKWLRDYHKKHKIISNDSGAIYQMKQWTAIKNIDLDRLKKREVIKDDDILLLGAYHSITYLMRPLQPDPNNPYVSLDTLIKLCNKVSSHLIESDHSRTESYIKRLLTYGTNEPNRKDTVIKGELESNMNFHQQFINQYVTTDLDLEKYYMVTHHCSLILSYVSDLNDAVSDIIDYDDPLDTIFINLVINDKLKNNAWFYDKDLSDKKIDKLVDEFNKALGGDTDVEQVFIDWINKKKEQKNNIMKDTYMNTMIKLWNISRFMTSLAFGKNIEMGFLDMFHPERMKRSTFKIDTLFKAHIDSFNYIDQLYPMIKVSSTNDVPFYMVRPYNVLTNVLPTHLYYIITDNNQRDTIELKEKQIIPIEYISGDGNTGTLTLSISLKPKQINSVITEHYSRKTLHKVKKELLFDIFKQSSHCNIKLDKMTLKGVGKTLAKDLKRPYDIDFRKLDVERIHNFIVSYYTIYQQSYKNEFNSNQIKKLIKKDKVVGTFFNLIKNYPVVNTSCVHIEIPVTTTDVQLFLDHIHKDNNNAFSKHFISKLSIKGGNSDDNTKDFIDLINDLTILYTSNKKKLEPLFFTINEKQVIEEAIPLWCGFYFAIYLFTNKDSKQFSKIQKKNNEWVKSTLNDLGRIMVTSTLHALQNRSPTEIELAEHIFQFRTVLDRVVFSSLLTLMDSLNNSGKYGKKSMSMKLYRQRVKKMDIEEKKNHLIKKEHILKILLNQDLN